MKQIKDSLFSRLFSYINLYRVRFVWALIFMAGSAATTAALMYLIKPTMDRIFIDGDAGAIPFIVLAIVAIALFKGGFTYGHRYFMAYVTQRVMVNVRNDLYRHLQTLSLPFYLTTTTGQIMSRATEDVRTLENAITVVPQKIIHDGLTIVFLAGMLFYLNWRWALVCIAVFPLVAYPLVIFARKLRRINREAQYKMGDIYSLLEEKISAMKVIQAFGMENQEIKRMKEENGHFLSIMMRVWRTVALQSPVMEFLSTLGICAVIGLGGYAVVKGIGTPGTFFAFIGAMSSMYAPIKGLASLNQQIQRASAGMDRIFAIMDMEPTVKENPNARKLESFKNEIALENVSFAYEKGELVLKDIDLKIKKGKMLALVGPSGGGKTTLVHLLPRFFDPTEGRITIDGYDLRDVTFKSLRQLIGMVTQDVILFNDTVANNIAYGSTSVTMEDVKRAGEVANATEFIEDMPQKYDTIIGERGVMLSGGQKQRIAIARAILRDPPILLLDEATSHLDVQSERLVQEALDRLMQHRTTVVIAHRLSTVRKAARIVVLNRGKIVEEGVHSGLLAKKGLYQHLYNLQFEE
jgi:subfamily B ATP-binding cassette protein MsbA